MKLTPITNDNVWIFSYNIKYYDLHRAIHELPRIDWATDDTLSRNRIKKGDIIYLYSGRPEQAVYYRCRAVEVDKPETTIDDTAYGGNPAGTKINCAELEIECEFADDGITYKELIEHGLKPGALTKRKITDAGLLEFIQKYEDAEGHVLEPTWYIPTDSVLQNKRIDIVDRTILFRHIVRFEDFIRKQDKNPNRPLSFSDKNGFLGREEYYKTEIAEAAREALACEDWREDWIGTGKIAECAKQAMRCAKNLVYSFGQIDFRNRLDRNRKEFKPNAERVLYDIYCGNDDEASFNAAMEVFGAKYPTIAYLFFIKDSTLYLPVSPDNFDEAFSLMESDFRMSGKCSWNNYQMFLDIVYEAQECLSESIQTVEDVTLLDAHSFIWIIQEEKYRKWGEDIDENVEIATALDKELDTLPLYGIEREAVRKERLNQGVFRKMLLMRGQSCALCGLSNPNLLTASHIKPWSVSEPMEKMDTDNGLLMCPNHDRLFDRGFISFDDEGKIMIASALNIEDRKLLNVDQDMKITVSDKNRIYLQYHRQYVYVK